MTPVPATTVTAMPVFVVVDRRGSAAGAVPVQLAPPLGQSAVGEPDAVPVPILVVVVVVVVELDAAATQLPSARHSEP